MVYRKQPWAESRSTGDPDGAGRRGGVIVKPAAVGAPFHAIPVHPCCVLRLGADNEAWWLFELEHALCSRGQVRVGVGRIEGFRRVANTNVKFLSLLAL